MAQKLIYHTGLLLKQSLNRIAANYTGDCFAQKYCHFMGTHRQISTTCSRSGLEEFFDDPKNYGSRRVRSGRAWRIDELRLKSNSDLHKLWYVLFKERNMLYTMQEAAKSESQIFPSPERIDKVEESMGNIENVVRERNNAYWKLEVSACATSDRPTVYRRDVFGRHRWHKCSQHIVPYYKNWFFRNQQGPGKTTETDAFFNKYREMTRKNYNYTRAKTARHLRELFRRFPNADVDYIEEKHPEFPAGYVRHLRDNRDLYDDPPSAMNRGSVMSVMKALKQKREEKLLE